MDTMDGTPAGELTWPVSQARGGPAPERPARRSAIRLVALAALALSLASAGG